MFYRVLTLCLLIITTISPVSIAQNQLDPRPLDPDKDPDIDMYMSSWKQSIPYNTHGTIVERAILTKCKGDPLKPHKKGAVLKYINRFSHAHIESHTSTTPTTLKGEQEIFYFTSGKGIAKAGKQTVDLHDGVFILMPAELEFTLTNTGEEPLTMYLINEPIPEGFRPNAEMLVKDEKAMPYRESGYLTFHWGHNGKGIFTTKDGLGTLEAVTLHTYNAMVITHPHSHDEGVEEVFTVVEGLNLAFLGKEIRWQPTGMAYMIPPTGYTPHCNINTTEEDVKALYFARYRDHEVRK